MRLAEEMGGEIVCADSMQVFRGLDVGTAKPTLAERARVRHHLFDVIGPDEAFSAARFRDLASQAVVEIAGRGRVPLVVGGTGLWIRALLDGLAPAPPADPGVRAELRRAEAEGGPGTLHRLLGEVDPEAAARLHPRDLVRLERALEVHRLTGRPISEIHAAHRFGGGLFPALRLTIQVPREVLDERIAARARGMFEAGWVDEVRRLLASGADPMGRGLRGLGYRRVVEHLGGAIDAGETLDRVIADTRAYARRQVQWFRNDDRARPLPPPPFGIGEALEQARAFLQDPPVVDGASPGGRGSGTG